MAIAVLDEVEIGAVSRTEKLLGFLDRGREEFAGSDLLEDASTQLLVRADLELVPRQSRRPIAELRSNCAERSRGSEVHKAEARAPSGLLPPAG